MDENYQSETVSEEACLKNSNKLEYTDRLLILNLSSLAEDYRKGEYQYFYARAGFGCYPDKLGTKVYGVFLTDGEKCQFRRCDFLGIADETKLPEWAKQKLSDLKKSETEELKKSDVQNIQNLG